MSRTTYQSHAIIEKKMINLSRMDPGPIICAWDDCERDAREGNRIRQCEHSPRYTCEQTDQGIGGGRHYWYHFCRERCRNYWLAASGRNAADTADRNQGRIYGMLPPGARHAL